jgi:hypothetical protein
MEEYLEGIVRVTGILKQNGAGVNAKDGINFPLGSELKDCTLGVEWSERMFFFFSRGTLPTLTV